MLQARRHIGIGHVLHARGDVEVALPGRVEGNVVQVALDAELHVAGRARGDRVAHVVARLLRDGQRQVAVHAGAVRAAQAAGQVQHAGKPRPGTATIGIAGVPVQPGLALRIGVGKLQFAGLHRDALALDLPAHVRRQLVHRHRAFLEYVGQHQGAVRQGQRGLAAGLRHVELHARAAQAGHVRCRAFGARLVGHRQPGHLAARLVLLQLLQGAAPGGLDLLHQPARRVVGQGGMHGGIQRQPAGDLRQRGQVEAVGAQFALLAAALHASVPHREVAARPAQCVLRGELQALGGELEPVGQAPPAHPAGDGLQRERLQPLAQAGVHPGQGEVGRAADELPALEIDPRAQRAAALGHLHAVDVDMVAQPGHVHAREIGEQLPRPLLPRPAVRRQERLAELPGELEPVAPLRRRRGLDPHAVAPAPVAQQQVHLPQGQGRLPALLVGQPHGAAAQHDLALREQPVGPGAVAARALAKRQPRDEDAAVRHAAHVEFRAFDVQLLEPHAQHRARRQRPHHARQLQGLAALGVQQGDVVKLDGGHQPFGAGRQRTDSHRYPSARVAWASSCGRKSPIRGTIQP